MTTASYDNVEMLLRDVDDTTFATGGTRVGSRTLKFEHPRDLVVTYVLFDRRADFTHLKEGAYYGISGRGRRQKYHPDYGDQVFFVLGGLKIEPSLDRLPLSNHTTYTRAHAHNTH